MITLLLLVWFVLPCLVDTLWTFRFVKNICQIESEFYEKQKTQKEPKDFNQYKDNI